MNIIACWQRINLPDNIPDNIDIDQTCRINIGRINELCSQDPTLDICEYVESRELDQALTILGEELEEKGIELVLEQDSNEELMVLESNPRVLNNPSSNISGFNILLISIGIGIVILILLSMVKGTE